MITYKAVILQRRTVLVDAISLRHAYEVLRKENPGGDILSLEPKILSMEDERGKAHLIDIRGIPTPACPCCGSLLLRVTVQFDQETYEISSYLLDDAECAECHCLITAPTPLDHSSY